MNLKSAFTMQYLEQASEYKIINNLLIVTFERMEKYGKFSLLWEKKV